MNARIRHGAASGVRHHRQRGADQHQRRSDQNRQRGHLHLPHIDFFAQELRGSANHQPGDKHRQQHKQQHPVEARTDTAKYHLAQLHQPHRHHPAQRGKGVVHGVHRAAGSCRRNHCKQAAVEDAEARLFAFHVGGAVCAHLQEVRIALQFSPHHHRHGRDKHQRHRPEQHVALTAVTHAFTEREAERRRDQKDAEHLHQVSQHGRVLKRMGRVGVEEASSVGAQHFDRLLRCHRPHRQRLLHPFQRGEVVVGRKVLNAALADKEQRHQQADGQ